jgi:hypothetical protein
VLGSLQLFNSPPKKLLPILRAYALNVYSGCCTAIPWGFWHPNSLAMSSDDRIRELCAIMSTAEGAELEAAAAELRSMLRTLLGDLQNVSTYNLINFPAALEKRKKA